MWEHLKDSVQTRASHLARDISDRFTHTDADQSSHRQQLQKNAMKNVVTPNSIPQFTLPPLFTYEVPPDINEKDEVDCDDEGDLSNICDNRKYTSKVSSANPNAYNKEHILATERGRDQQKLGQLQHQPGLTLQHLLSTKSGFSTLTESPTTKRKESLFLSPSPSYHVADSGVLSNSGSHEVIRETSSDSDLSRGTSPSSSPMIGIIKQKRFIGRNVVGDSDSNSSCPSSPFHSPAQHRKIQAKTNHELHSPGSSRNTISNTDAIKKGKKVKRSRSASSVLPHCVKMRDEVKSETISSTMRVHMILTYLRDQQKLNASIVECENLTDGRFVGYLKMSLLPRVYSSFHTDFLSLNPGKLDIRERFSFNSVAKDDVGHVSLEISFKEKSSGIRQHKKTLGKAILPLCDIQLADSNDLWVELQPFELEERPHIQLSMCYHAMLGFVTIDVIAVRNVPKGTLGRYHDCYVVLTEEPSAEKSSKKQTKISHREKDPVFEESFIFSMSSDQPAIVATLFIKDRVKGHWLPYGAVRLGHVVDSWSGQLQWSQALAREGQPVIYWHLLQAAARHEV